jgi:hypothetical protein
LEAKDFTRVADVLVATTITSNQELSDLGESMKKVAPLAAKVGLSVEDVSKALGVLANSNIRGSEAGVALRRSLVNLADPKIKKFLNEDLKIPVATISGDMRDLATIIFEVGDATKNLGNLERLAVFAKVFGARAAAAGVTLQTREAFEELTEAVDKSNGAAAKLAKIMDDTLGGSMRIAWSAVTDLFIAIGESLAPMLRDVLGRVQNVATAITGFVEGNRKLVVALFLIVAGIGAVGAAFVAAGIAGAIFAGLMSGLAAVAAAVATAFVFLAKAFMLLFTPVGLLIAGVVTLGVVLGVVSGAFGKAIEFMKRKFSELSDRAQMTFEGIRKAIAAGDISAAWEVLASAMKLTWLELTKGLRTGWAAFVRFFNEIGIIGFFGTLGVMNEVSAGIEKAWAHTMSFISKAAAATVSAVKFLLSTLSTKVAEVMLRIRAMGDKQRQKTLQKDIAALWIDNMREGLKQDDELKKRFAEIDRRRIGEISKIERVRAATSEAITDEMAQAQVQADLKQQRAVDKVNKDLEDAKDRFTKAVEEANRVFEEKFGEGAEPPDLDLPEGIDVNFSDFVKDLGEMSEEIGDELVRPAEVIGVVGGDVAGRLGFGMTMDRTARATEQIADSNQRILDAIEEGVLDPEVAP